MNTRIPYSAKKLIETVVEKFPDVTVERRDLDGLNVYRTIAFTSEDATEWLTKGDLALLLDQRIVAAASDGEEFIVTFVGDSRADYTTPAFSIQEVADLSEVVPEGVTEAVVEVLSQEGQPVNTEYDGGGVSDKPKSGIDGGGVGDKPKNPTPKKRAPRK